MKLKSILLKNLPIYGLLHLHFCVAGSQIPPNKHRFESHVLSIVPLGLVAAMSLVVSLSSLVDSAPLISFSEEPWELEAMICWIC